MKALYLILALAFGSPAFAGGAIGGSTGSKCAEHIILNSMEFQRLIHQVMTKGELIIHGESMRVEILDLDEQVIEMWSLENEERSVIWYVEIRDWD
ncbi:hypothetical protein [Oligoflexus tunisiensis]|uniref:hypothetical protein n=1 Tax=Oligoflexus tunisiensis TaxID=708132 RepID=UPI00114D1473|nr:hypothetical protein [Oligoflexus tunisiensis]